MSERKTILEIVLHEEKRRTTWAEWDLYWHDGDKAESIGCGTGPSLEGCIDKALAALDEHRREGAA